MIKVSVVIPVYNVEKYLERCLDSLIAQTLKEIEIICIDDGSTDSSGEILQKYAKQDERIIVIKQENQGQGAARNRGMKAAAGKYIGFVDSDDWIDADFFEKLYDAAEKHGSDIAVASILKHKKSYCKYNVLYKKTKTADSIESRIKLCFDKKKNFFNCWNKLCKASVIKDNGIKFPEGMIFEDVLFAAELLFHADKVTAVPGVCYHYIQNPNSTVNSKAKRERRKKDHKKAFADLIKFAHSNNIKLPERCNYIESCRKFLIFKVYKGIYKTKYTLFGLIPLLKVKTKENI